MLRFAAHASAALPIHPFTDIESGTTFGGRSEIAKAVSLTDAMARLQTGNPNIKGFFTRQSDFAGASSADDVIKRVRPEYDGSPFSAGESFAVIQTRGPNVSGSAEIPRSNGFGGNTSGEYPYTGNGFAASLDGHLTPEWRLAVQLEQWPPHERVIRIGTVAEAENGSIINRHRADHT